jgi:ankyrin repeat protein
LALTILAVVAATTGFGADEVNEGMIGPGLTFQDEAKPVDIPLVRAGNYLFAPLRIDGKDVGLAWIDTGTQDLMLDPGVVDSLNLKRVFDGQMITPAGVSGGPIVAVRSMQLGTVSLDRTFAVQASLQTFAKSIGVEKLAGVVGMAYLRCGAFALDYKRACLTLYPRGVELDVGGEWRPIRLTRGRPEVRARLNGVEEAWFLVDSGADSALLLSPSFARFHHHLFDGKTSTPRLIAFANGNRVVFDMPADDLEIAKVHFPSIRVSIPRGNEPSQLDELAGAVGMEVLRRFRITVDVVHERACLEPYGDAALAEWSSASFDPNAADLAGVTPLMRAAGDGLAGHVDAFLKRGAKVEDVDRFSRASALTYAARSGQVGSIDALLAHGASLNAVNGIGETPLITALAAGHAKAAERLLNAGADVQVADMQGQTALMLACRVGEKDLVEDLLKRGGDVNKTDKRLGGPLHYAVVSGKEEMVSRLVRAAADVNVRGAGGDSALMLACQRRDRRIVETLLAAGANVNQVNDNGDAALHFAAASGDAGLVEKLIAAGANKRARNRAGQTAMDAANGYSAVMALLYPWEEKKAE